MTLRDLIKDRLEEYEAEIYRRNRRRREMAKRAAMIAELVNIESKLRKPLTWLEPHIAQVPRLQARAAELKTALGLVEAVSDAR